MFDIYIFILRRKKQTRNAVIMEICSRRSVSPCLEKGEVRKQSDHCEHHCHSPSDGANWEETGTVSTCGYPPSDSNEPPCHRPHPPLTKAQPASQGNTVSTSASSLVSLPSDTVKGPAGRTDWFEVMSTLAHGLNSSSVPGPANHVYILYTQAHQVPGTVLEPLPN